MDNFHNIDANATDLFGTAVSIDGNYSAVGASGDDDNAEDGGSVTVYKKDQYGGWSKDTRDRKSVV